MPESWWSAPGSLAPLIAVFTIGIFVLDLMTPLGWADGFLYLIPLTLLFRSSHLHRLIGFAALCSGLIVLGWFLSPEGGTAGQAAYNRVMGIAMLWMTALFLEHRKQVEEVLHRAQAEDKERFGLLMNHANDAILCTNLNGVIQWASAQTTILTGRSMTGLVGRSITAVFTPEAAMVGESRLAAIRRGEAVPPLVEFTILRPDGKVVEVEGNITSVKYGEEMVGRLLVLRDITERKRAEEALRESEKRNRAILESATDAVITITREGRIVEFNPAAEAIFGYMRGSVIGREMLELIIPPSLRESHRKGMMRYLDTGQTSIRDRRIEVTAMHADGTEFPVELTVTSLTLEGQTLFTAFIRDITRRKQTDKALILFRSLIDRTNDAIEIIDAKTGRFLDVNEQACRTHGYTREEYLALTVSEIDPLVAAHGWEKAMEENRRAGSRIFNGQHRRKDGSVFPVEVNITYVYLDREYVLAIVRDITERKRVERELQENQTRLQLAVQSTNLGPWDWDLLTNVAYLSPEWKRQIGYENDEIPNRYEEWESRLHPEDREATVAALRAYLDGRRPEYALEFRLRHKDGSYRWIYTRGEVLRDADGNPVRVVGCHLDITDRKMAEEERRGLYERLQASHDGLRMLSRRLLEVQEKERHHIAREMHDEVGQALTAAKIIIQQALHTLAAPDARTHLEESVGILDEALQQVRNLSLDLRPSLLDDLGLASTLRWMADRHAHVSGLTVTFSSDVSEFRAPADIELACYRIAQEALTNAIRHARATRVVIVLSRSDREFQLVVRDDGVGFDLSGMLKRAREGKSIGLLGMRERVALVGGQLDVQTRPGIGTVVHARFPLLRAGIPSAEQV